MKSGFGVCWSMPIITSHWFEGRWTDRRAGVIVMKRFLSHIILLIPLAIVAFPGCSGHDFVFPEVEGWMQEGEVSVYDAESLWEYINGAAELFVDYGVETCRTADLSSDDVTVSVDLYDMGSPLNAFGIFNLESSGVGEIFPGAVEAVIFAPYQALLIKGSIYVKVDVFEGELNNSIGKELLNAIANELPGQKSYPEELGLLPEAGRIAGSEGYQARGFLGLAELNNCIFAEYSGESDETWTGFVVNFSAGSSSLWTELAGQWESLEHNGSTVLYRKIPYRGLVGVVQTGQGIEGVSGVADQEELLSRLDLILSDSGH